MEYETGRYRSSASLDVLKATKELLGNNEYAISAIRSRNRRIKDLVDIINHQRIAFREIEDRYDEMAKSKNIAEHRFHNLEEEYAILFKSWKETLEDVKTTKELYNALKDEHSLLVALRDKSLSRKVENYADKVGGKRGALIKLLFTPPVSKISTIIVFVIIFSASIIGWEPILGSIKYLFKLLIF